MSTVNCEIAEHSAPCSVGSGSRGSIFKTPLFTIFFLVEIFVLEMYRILLC